MHIEPFLLNSSQITQLEQYLHKSSQIYTDRAKRLHLLKFSEAFAIILRILILHLC